MFSIAIPLLSIALMDEQNKSKVSARWRSYRKRLKNDPNRLRQVQEKRRVLNSRRKKINEMSEEEKKQYREKKKLYMASYRRKLKEKKEETEADSAIVPGKTKNDE